MHYVRPEDHVTTQNLPASGYLNVYATVEIHTTESVAHGDTDRRGWASSLDQPDEPAEHRNDVKPLMVAALPLDEEGVEELRDIITMLGAIESENGSTLYAVDDKTYDLTTDETWHYAIHAHVKHLDVVSGRFVEDDARIIK